MRVQNDKVYALLKGRSQTEIAEKMGCHLPHVNFWLNGVRQPRYDRLCQLATALDIPVDELALKLREISKERKNSMVNSKNKQDTITNVDYPQYKVSPKDVRVSVDIYQSGAFTVEGELLTNKEHSIAEFIKLAEQKFPLQGTKSEYEFDKLTSKHKIWLSI